MKFPMDWKTTLTNRRQAVTISRHAHRNKRQHHKDVVLYHGVIELSDEALSVINTAPVYRTRDRHCVIRGKDAEGTVWLVKSYIENVTLYLGEIVLTQAGRYRVHLFHPATATAPDGSLVLAGKTLEKVKAEEEAKCGPLGAVSLPPAGVKE